MARSTDASKPRPIFGLQGGILNVGSLNGIQGLPNVVAYAAAKGGLLSMTRTLAGAVAHDRIRVNHLIPGWVLTEGEMALHGNNGITVEALKKPASRWRVAATKPWKTLHMRRYICSPMSQRKLPELFST